MMCLMVRATLALGTWSNYNDCGVDRERFMTFNEKGSPVWSIKRENTCTYQTKNISSATFSVNCLRRCMVYL